MKFTFFALALFSPLVSWAQLAGNWAGVVTDAQGAHRIVLHISGPFTAMKGSADIPDQKLSNIPVGSITFLESTLDFSIPASDVRYSGVLNDNGAIMGTFTQHGVGMPLVLSRVAPQAVPTVAAPGGVIENGRYRDKITGVEFDVPSSWVVSRAEHEPGTPGSLTVFEDRSGKATIATVNMAKVTLTPEGVSKILDLVIARQIAMRDGQSRADPVHEAPNYRIREGSLDRTDVAGHPAMRAIGEFERKGKSFAELLAWVYSEHTRTYFMVRATAENLPLLQASFDQMMQSVKIP